MTLTVHRRGAPGKILSALPDHRCHVFLRPPAHWSGLRFDRPYGDRDTRRKVTSTNALLSGHGSDATQVRSVRCRPAGMCHGRRRGIARAGVDPSHPPRSRSSPSRPAPKALPRGGRSPFRPSRSGVATVRRCRERRLSPPTYRSQAIRGMLSPDRSRRRSVPPVAAFRGSGGFCLSCSRQFSPVERHHLFHSSHESPASRNCSPKMNQPIRLCRLARIFSHTQTLSDTPMEPGSSGRRRPSGQLSPSTAASLPEISRRRSHSW